MRYNLSERYTDCVSGSISAERICTYKRRVEVGETKGNSNNERADIRDDVSSAQICSCALRRKWSPKRQTHVTSMHLGLLYVIFFFLLLLRISERRETELPTCIKSVASSKAIVIAKIVTESSSRNKPSRYVDFHSVLKLMTGMSTP